MIPRTVIRRGLRLLALALVVVVALVGLLAAAFRVQFTGAPAGWAKSTGNDALWLGHMWVDGRRTRQDVQNLAVRLRGTGIKDVYVHSGPFAADGRLDPAKYPAARDFLAWVREALPGVRVSAWLGQKVDGTLDLDDAESRANVLDGVRDVVAAGYDGVHYNFEPIGSGDEEFLDLLARTRPLTRLLSTSTPQVEPYPLMRLTARAAISHDKYWSQDYFRRVAERVDQVAVMTYDTGMPSGSLYGGFVARQAELALGLVPERTHLLIGAPAYHDHGVSWSDGAESVADAARAAKLALSEHGPRRNFGLALYVDFAATEEDWREYAAQWLV
ncbi:hypothetical protein MTP10_16935 [Nonomuraea sp. 3-1Str]|uniref:hypothetical protein n=1 Tax=Nonomuraea sp. 3-1Str TaxID=2929801 RepID=UPI0028628F7C|nr:hypothetical protein [Nonomuraea sp. 3-1Str]MDR8410415.1 hypothetical protein [Nonomuraea sp. 3-1Str]